MELDDEEQLEEELLLELEQLDEDELLGALLELGSSSSNASVCFLDTVRRSCLASFGFRVVIGLPHFTKNP